MNIAILIDGLARGGAERQAIYATLQLARLHHAVELIYYHHTEDQYEYPALENATFTFLAKGNRPFCFIWRLAAYFREKNFDIVHGFKGTASLYAGIAARLAGVPVVFGGFRVEYQNAGFHSFIYKMINYVVDGWIVNSHAIIDSMVRLTGIKPDKFLMVRNGINSTEVESRLTAIEARHKLGLQAESQTVSMIARLSPQKNHQMFIDMAATLVTELPDVRFFIVGDGESRPALEAQVKFLHLSDKIMFLGIRLDIADILAATDVVVLTSNFEGTPNCLLEAMAAGRPVVTTAFADAEKIVSDGRNGFIVPCGDSWTMAKKVGCLLKKPELRRQMGVIGQKTVADSYSIEQMGLELQNVYENCLQNRSLYKFDLRSRHTKSVYHPNEQDFHI